MSILRVNYSYVCFIYTEIFEKMLSGGLEVLLIIYIYATAKKQVSHDADHFYCIYLKDKSCIGTNMPNEIIYDKNH